MAVFEIYTNFCPASMSATATRVTTFIIVYHQPKLLIPLLRGRIPVKDVALQYACNFDLVNTAGES
jgi:hypothetical protein